jgi:glyoxylase-like metal-dependent hydrolase (beta-lactamase superfamily II)
MTYRKNAWLLSLALLFVLYHSFALAQQAPVREISNITGELYRFRNAGYFSVFLVTPEGIIATDPIDADAARWLKGEMAKRFNKPVKYLIYSHDHADHISGGEVFGDTAVVISHEKTKAVILREKRAAFLPHRTFSDRLAVELGGKRVELLYVGRNHSDNSIVMRFPAERVLFAVDFIPVESLPYRTLNNSYIDEWIESLKRVEALDFDILAPGHGPMGRKEHVRPMREYLEELKSQVAANLKQGKSVEEIKQSVKMEKYRNWSSYDSYRPLNIEGMVRYLQQQSPK